MKPVAMYHQRAAAGRAGGGGGGRGGGGRRRRVEFRGLVRGGEGWLGSDGRARTEKRMASTLGHSQTRETRSPACLSAPSLSLSLPFRPSNFHPFSLSLFLSRSPSRSLFLLSCSLILEFRHSAPLIMQALFSTHLTDKRRNL